MLVLLFGFVIGVLIGWNWPQPEWARDIQRRFVNFVRSTASKTDR